MCPTSCMLAMPLARMSRQDFCSFITIKWTFVNLCCTGDESSCWWGSADTRRSALPGVPWKVWEELHCPGQCFRLLDVTKLYPRSYLPNHCFFAGQLWKPHCLWVSWHWMATSQVINVQQMIGLMRWLLFQDLPQGDVEEDPSLHSGRVLPPRLPPLKMDFFSWVDIRCDCYNSDLLQWIGVASIRL